MRGVDCIDCGSKLTRKGLGQRSIRCQPCIAINNAKRSDRNEEIMRLRNEGLSTYKIAARLGLGSSTVRDIIALETSLAYAGDDYDPPVDGKLPRCRCGLLLPCNSCLPTIYAVASSRREAP